jgi:hypothetical protein
MKAAALLVLGLIGCGSVGAPAQPDAAPVCTVQNTVDSCGPTCTKCTSTGRGQPSCDGTSCGTVCAPGAACSDQSCPRFEWTFDSNSLDDVVPLAPAGLSLAVRNHAGNLALAIPVTNLSEISFKVPVCLSGNVQLQTRTLSATIFLEGGTATGDQYYMQTSTPRPMNGAFLLNKPLSSGSYITYTAPMSASTFANTATDVVFQVGSFGAQFTGTIWIDDIKIQ